MVKRKVIRTQNAQYVRGSVKHQELFAYSIQGIEYKGAGKQYFDIEGADCEDSKAAIQAAWKAAREWVAEIGEVVKTEGEYTATKE